MTRDQVLSDLFTSRDFTSCIGKMKPVELQDDLKAEVALILCEMDEAKLIGLAERNELKFYTVRIILNQIQSKTSPFFRKYRMTASQFSDLRYTTKKPEYQSIISVPIDFNNEFNPDSYSDVTQNRWSKTGQNIENALSSTPDAYDDSKDRAMSEIDNLYWYDKEMLRLYAEHGTYRKIEEVTGIPFESVYKTVQRACKEIRRRVA